MLNATRRCLCSAGWVEVMRWLPSRQSLAKRQRLKRWLDTIPRDMLQPNWLRKLSGSGHSQPIFSDPNREYEGGRGWSLGTSSRFG